MSEAEPKHKFPEPKGQPSCKHCGATSFKDGRLFEKWSDVGLHVRTECEKYVPPPRKVKEAPPGEGEETIPSPLTVPHKEGVELGDTEEEILENVLKHFTSLTDKAIKTVMDWVYLQGPIHPTQLVSILMHEVGLKTQYANMIAQKYAYALNKVQREKAQKPPLFFGPPSLIQTQQPSIFPWQYPQQAAPQWPPQQPYAQYPPPQQHWQYPPQQQYPPRPVEPDEIAKKAAEEISRNFESRFRDFEREIRSMRETSQSYPQEQMVETYEPIRDLDGSIVRDADGEVVVKKTLTPVSIMKQKDPMTEVYRLLYESRKAEKGEGPPPLTEEKIREIVREATAKEPLSEEKVKDIIESVMEKQRPTTKDPDIMRLEGELKEARRGLEDMKDKFTEKEKEYLQNQLNQVQTQLGNLQTSIMNIPSGEWKSDEIKALTITMKEVASILKEKKPVDTLLEKGPKVLRTLQPGIPMEAPELTRKPVQPAPQPPPKPQAKPPPKPPEKVDEVTQELRKHGLSVRLE